MQDKLKDLTGREAIYEQFWLAIAHVRTTGSTEELKVTQILEQNKKNPAFEKVYEFVGMKLYYNAKDADVTNYLKLQGKFVDKINKMLYSHTMHNMVDNYIHDKDLAPSSDAVSEVTRRIAEKFGETYVGVCEALGKIEKKAAPSTDIRQINHEQSVQDFLLLNCI